MDGSSGMSKTRPWSLREFKQLEAFVVEHGKQWGKISELMGRTPHACEFKYNFEKRREKQGAASAGPSNQFKADKLANAAAAAARQHLSTLPPRTLTAQFFGDPPAGRSALDQRQAEPSIRSISLGGAR
jgi:Myb-like DNA-binding protein